MGGEGGALCGGLAPGVGGLTLCGGGVLVWAVVPADTADRAAAMAPSEGPVAGLVAGGTTGSVPADDGGVAGDAVVADDGEVGAAGETVPAAADAAGMDEVATDAAGGVAVGGETGGGAAATDEAATAGAMTGASGESSKLSLYNSPTMKPCNWMLLRLIKVLYGCLIIWQAVFVQKLTIVSF